MNTAKSIVFPVGGAKVVHHGGMAPHAVLLKDRCPATGNDNGFMKILKRKPLGVAVAVIGFGDVFGRKRLRQMAVHAGRRRVMAGFLPRIKLRSHDMTIQARPRVRPEIRKPRRVMKRIYP